MLAIALILVSALSNAVIGALIKTASDKIIFRGMINSTSGLVAFIALVFVPFPTPELYLILFLSVGTHLVYALSQALAFEHGDMSVVYPVMRGMAPFLAALFGISILSEALTSLEVFALLIVGVALIGFGWPDKSDAKPKLRAVGFAIFCGMMTALYTVVDAYGVRLADQAWTFIIWFFFLEGLGMAFLVFVWKRKTMAPHVRRDWKRGVIAGCLGLITYGTALLAYSLAPIAQMAALRETSIVFGAIIAATVLKEPFGRRRIWLAGLLVMGLMALQFAA